MASSNPEKSNNFPSFSLSFFFEMKINFYFFIFIFCFFSPLIFICWRLITLDYCSGFCHTLTRISHGFTCVPHPDIPPTSVSIPVFAILWHKSAMDLHVFPIPIPLPLPSPSHPSGSSQCTSPEHSTHASNLGWWSVSPLIVYLFQYCSHWTSHPRLLPQSLKVCSVHLCLFFCFAYKVIVTIFLNSIHMF